MLSLALSPTDCPEHAPNFVLKGATLFTIREGFAHRQTRDMDLLGYGDRTAPELEVAFREIIRIDIPEVLTFF